MKPSKKALRIFFILLVVLLIIIVAYFALRDLIPDFVKVLRSGNEEQIEEYIRSKGSWTGMLITAALQTLQILSILLSSVPIQIAAGIIFGLWHGFAVCLVPSLMTHFAVFSLARALGDKYSVIDDDDNRVSRWPSLKNSRHPAFTLLLLFMIPLMPNGIIPYLAAKSSICRRDFMIVTAVGITPSILIFCAVGNRLLEGDFLMSAILIGALMLTMLALYLCRNRLFALAEKVNFDTHS